MHRQQLRYLLLTLACLAAISHQVAAQGLNPFQVFARSSQPTCRVEPGAAHEFCGLPYELSNFQGHFKCDKAVLVGRPSNVQELARLVEAYDKVKAVGVGHSWWKEQMCAGGDSRAINVVMTELTDVRAGGPIKVDEASLTVTCPAGVTQRTLLNFLDSYRTDSAPDGYTLGAFAWYLDQTIGGALATATHGSSLMYGSLSSQARALKVMVANGSIVELSPAKDAHLWKAAATHVGRLGITLEVTLSIVKNTRVRRTKTDLGVTEFVADIKELSGRFSEALASSGAKSMAVWEAVKPWDETQWFWFMPSKLLWRATFKRMSPYSGEEVEQVLASNGPDGEELLPGAFQQQTVQTAGTGAGIERNAKTWSDMYRAFLAPNVVPGVLPARQAYLSVSEMESRTSASTSYDQYEAAIPLSKAGECVAALSDELYGPKERWNGFRAPALVRLIRAENAYLSPAHGEPVLYINIEDHVSYATKRPNEDFQAVMRLLRSPVCGPARLHWGKAGWPEHAKCFDGSKEYPSSWCDFGCAVQQLDPTGKFGGMSDVWQWRAVDRASGREVQDFGSCCTSTGFDKARCSCAGRAEC